MEQHRSTEIAQKGTVLIVSHDAGGAEILSSLLKLNDIKYLLCLDGPAVDIFNSKIGSVDNYHLSEGIKLVDWVLTGTSWASDLEYHAIRLAKKNRKFVASFLDHWVNYRERFTWHGPEILPNEIWVGDEDAYALASSIFYDLSIKFFPNPYWGEIKHSFDYIKNKENDKLSFLFASANMDGIGLKQKAYRYSDQEILIAYLKNLPLLFPRKNLSKITLSLHPSENQEKYNSSFLKKHNLILSTGRSIPELINSHMYVAGVDSMVSVIAKICGKQTINIEIMNIPSVIPDKYIDYKIVLEA